MRAYAAALLLPAIACAVAVPEPQVGVVGVTSEEVTSDAVATTADAAAAVGVTTILSSTTSTSSTLVSSTTEAAAGAALGAVASSTTSTTSSTSTTAAAAAAVLSTTTTAATITSAADAAAASSYSLYISTQWVETTISGTSTWVPITYTMTFWDHPDQLATAGSGEVGYGTLTATAEGKQATGAAAAVGPAAGLGWKRWAGVGAGVLGAVVL